MHSDHQSASPSKDGVDSGATGGDLYGLMAALPDPTSPTAAVLRLLMDRLARLEADVFVLKSCLAADRRFVMAEAAGDSDPMQVVAAPDRSGRGVPRARLSRIEVPLGPTLLGHGWHGVEPRGEGGFWRWSGPATVSTLMLPSLGEPRHTISWAFEVLERAQLDGLSVMVNGRAPVTLEVAWQGERSGTVALTAEEPEGAMAGYLYVEIAIAGTRRPRDHFPSQDGRWLGMGLGACTVSLPTSES